jgi:hypothetical protein
MFGRTGQTKKDSNPGPPVRPDHHDVDEEAVSTQVSIL